MSNGSRCVCGDPILADGRCEACLLEAGIGFDILDHVVEDIREESEARHYLAAGRDLVDDGGYLDPVEELIDAMG